MEDEGNKLYYFNANGRAMIIRAILYYSKTKFDNILITKENWKIEKKSGKFQYEQLPMLEFEGKKYVQSHAIELFLGRTFKLYGKNNEEDYQINTLLDSFDDLFSVFKHVFDPITEEDKQHIEDYKRALLNKYEFFAESCEKKYISNGGKKYYLGDNFTLADVFLTCTFYYYADLMGIEKSLEEHAPKLSKVLQSVKNNELKEFYDKAYFKESEY